MMSMMEISESGSHLTMLFKQVFYLLGSLIPMFEKMVSKVEDESYYADVGLFYHTYYLKSIPIIEKVVTNSDEKLQNEEQDDKEYVFKLFSESLYYESSSECQEKLCERVISEVTGMPLLVDDVMELEKYYDISADFVWDCFEALFRKERGSVKFIPLRVCRACEKKEDEGVKLSKCSSCKNVYYCSTECQKKHWKHHKRVCKKI